MSSINHTPGPVASTASAYSTPDNSPIEDFISSLGYSPPVNPAGKTQQDVKNFAQYLQIDFDALVPLKKVKLAFLVLREQPEMMRSSLVAEKVPPNQIVERIKAATADALEENTKFGRKLSVFARKGGDLTFDASSVKANGASPDFLGTFLTTHPEWKDNTTAPTIFNPTHGAVDAFVRFQDDSSTVCFVVAAANAAFYSKYRCIQPGGKEQAVTHYALNISRFMRNRFDNVETFDAIFRGKGGSVEAVLRRLLEPSNPGKDLLLPVTIHHQYSVEGIFWVIRGALDTHGALVIEAFKVFTEFVEKNGVVSFSGHYNTKTPSLDQYNRNVTHAMLVVGVRLTGSSGIMGGLEFLVQNTSIEKPFVVIGLDLLRSMEVNRFLGIQPNLHFKTDPNDIDPTTVVTVSGGSPAKCMDLNFFKDDNEIPPDFLWSPFGSQSTKAHDDSSSVPEEYWQKVPEDVVCMQGGF